MKKKEALRAMSELDARYIEEANEERKFGVKRGSLIKGLSVAASLLLVCGIVSIPFLKNIANNDNKTVDADIYLKWNAELGVFEFSPYDGDILYRNEEALSAAVQDTYPELDTEIAIEPIPGKGQSTQESVVMPGGDTVKFSYPRLTSDAFSEYSWHYTSTAKANIGDAVGSGDMTIAYYTANDEPLSYPAVVYEIDGIDPAFAVAVKVNSDAPIVKEAGYYERYFVYFRKHIVFDNFAEMKTALSLESTLAVGEELMEAEYTESGIVTTLVRQPQNVELQTLLMALEGEARSVYQIAEDSVSLGIDCKISALGEYDIGIQIFEEGYLMTNIGGVLRVFEIGKESAEKLIDYAKETPASFDKAYRIHEDGMMGEKDAGEQTLPYNPMQSSAGYNPDDVWETTGELPDTQGERTEILIDRSTTERDIAKVTDDSYATFATTSEERKLDYEETTTETVVFEETQSAE